MRNTYLIDFENVGSEGLNGVSSLTAEDRVILFYSANSNRMTVRAHQAIVASPARFDYFEVAVGGKNALDHQLGTYLGYLVATNASERYFIVSHDNGFKFLSTFWLAQNPGLLISMCDNIKVSLRVRPTERPRPANRSEQPAEPRPEPKPEVRPAAEAPAAVEVQPEPQPEPAAAVTEEAPVKVLEPVVEIPAELPPEPAVEIPAELSPEPAAETQPEPAAEVRPEPAVVSAAEPQTEQPAGPLPALGSQSRSRGNSQRGRVRSESILATLKRPEPVRTPAVEPAAPAPVQERPKPVEEPPVEPLPEAAKPVAMLMPAPAESPAEPAAEPVEAAETQEPAESGKSSRSRRRRTRSNRKEQRPEEAKSEDKKPEDKKPEEKQPEDRKPGEKQPEESEPRAEEPRPESKPGRAAKPEAKPAAAKPYALGDAASAALTTLLQEHPKVSEARVRELIAGSKKQILCNTLRRQLGQEQGLALYNQIKKLAWK